MRSRTNFLIFILSVAALAAFSGPVEAFWFWGNKAAAASKPQPLPSSPPVLAEEKSLTLPGAYAIALKRSEKMGITAEEIRLAQARFYRAFDYFLPTVDFQITRFDQDTSGVSTSADATLPSKHENKFTFSQPLFSGFKEFAALRGSNADKKERERLFRRAQELLFVDVTGAYYGVLQTQKDAGILEEQHQLLEDRLRELSERVRVGRSRETETQSLLSDQKTVEADLVLARAAAVHAINLLEFYLGEPLEDRRLIDEDILAESDKLQAYLPKTYLRSDVQAAEEDYLLAQSRVVAAQADLFPTISADGNYYTRRVGSQNGNDWDVTLKFKVPVFEIGQTLGDIREAASLRQQSMLRLRQTKRLAELDIRDAFEDLTSARAAERALKEASEAAKKNYDLQAEDYRHNLVNNLDVLDALRHYQDSSRRYNQVFYQAKRNYWKFKVALGELPVETKK